MTDWKPGDYTEEGLRICECGYARIPLKFYRSKKKKPKHPDGLTSRCTWCTNKN